MSRKRRKNYRKRSRKDRGSSRRVFLGLIFGILALSAVVAAGVYFSRDGAEKVEGPPRAAIVDQLSLTYPNPSFVQNARNTLELAGYQVEYISGEEATVDLYRNLPRGGYDYLIFRNHSARANWSSSEPTGWVPLLFTAEKFSFATYPEDNRKMSLGRVRYYNSDEWYFGIGPHFIDKSVRGRFKDTVVIAMGCDGLNTEALARAFVEKGAATVIGWDKSVSASHTDTATQQLLQHLLVEKIPPEQAIDLTMKEVGADPTFGARLRPYP